MFISTGVCTTKGSGHSGGVPFGDQIISLDHHCTPVGRIVGVGIRVDLGVGVGAHVGLKVGVGLGKGIVVGVEAGTGVAVGVSVGVGKGVSVGGNVVAVGSTV